MQDESRPCPNCASVQFSAEVCSRCGRPRLPDPDYFDRLETFALGVVNAGHDEYPDLRATAATGPRLQRAVVDLANTLVHYHYDGDGCLDEDPER